MPRKFTSTASKLLGKPGLAPPPPGRVVPGVGLGCCMLGQAAVGAACVQEDAQRASRGDLAVASQRQPLQDGVHDGHQGHAGALGSWGNCTTLVSFEFDNPGFQNATKVAIDIIRLQNLAADAAEGTVRQAKDMANSA